MTHVVTVPVNAADFNSVFKIDCVLSNHQHSSEERDTRFCPSPFAHVLTPSYQVPRDEARDQAVYHKSDDWHGNEEWLQVGKKCRPVLELVSIDPK
jgi:hypothetical protein